VAFAQHPGIDRFLPLLQARIVVSRPADNALCCATLIWLSVDRCQQARGGENMSRRLWAAGVAMAGFCLCAPAAVSETQISVYGGTNWNFDSDVKLRGAPGIPDEERSVSWDGGPFEMPPYWGVRGVYWLGKGSPWGFAVDYTHQKALADIDFAADKTYDRLEFTDGNNLLLFEVLYRFGPTMNGTLVPYVGAGVGVTIPHVEVTLDSGGKTFEYQLAGPAAQILAGLEYKLAESWSLFTEFKLSYSQISADLKGGGQLETDLWSPQLAIGLTYRFPQ
jgi:lipid A oxidase